MNFTELYGDKIFGAIRGLDRVRFRGTIRWIANEQGIRRFLGMQKVLLKNFKSWAQSKTDFVRKCCGERAEELGIPMMYLESGDINKEELAREIAAERGVRKDGSICMFSVVEPCWAPSVAGNRASKQLELRMRSRRCIWIYHYWDDPSLGFGHVRLQTWLPMTAQICLNGRHWLEKQLIANKVAYVKDGNCFPWIEDVGAAQGLLDEQLRTNWPQLLDHLTERLLPQFHSVFAPLDLEHYWSADETEFATDVMFKSVADLDQLFPALVHYGMKVSDSPAVMRYLGRRKPEQSGMGGGKAPREIRSDCRKLYEGLRIKHAINGNSIKSYNKSGSVLRVETTINNTRDFKAFRHPDDDESKPASWQKLRKGVSDLHRRAQISSQCNDRYLDAVCAIQVDETLHEVMDGPCKPICRKNGQRHRALNPWSDEDFKLLTFLANGEHHLNGFRNRDLRQYFDPSCQDQHISIRRRLSGKATRMIRLLRAHGLIRKVPKANRYVLTKKGRKFSHALMAASTVETKQLTDIAA
jgi:hypothetical protein